jgi:hypothetical protein
MPPSTCPCRAYEAGVHPLSNGAAPPPGPALAKEVASVSVHCSVNEKGAPLNKKTNKKTRELPPLLLRIPFFGCVLLRPPPPRPPLAIAARAVAALVAPRVRAACSARATTFRSGAPKTCGHTYSRKIAPRFMPCCSGTVSAARRHVRSTGVPGSARTCTVSGGSVGTLFAARRFISISVTRPPLAEERGVAVTVNCVVLARCALETLARAQWDPTHLAASSVARTSARSRPPFSLPVPAR